MKNEGLHKFWWLWLPLLLTMAQAIMECLPEHVRAPLMSEEGPHELLQALFAGIGLVIALWTLVRMPVRHSPWLAAWIGIAALCCLYVVGEEVSWGQQLLHWTTPEYWSQVNDQHETNLHNTSSWFDQKPRLLLEIGVTTGGLIIPLLKKYRPGWLPVRFEIIYPSATLALVAGLNILVRLSDLVGAHVFRVHLYERASEVQELCMYYFVFLYLLELKTRVLPAAARSIQPDGTGAARSSQAAHTPPAPPGSARPASPTE
jgi:hypothetical protein